MALNFRFFEEDIYNMDLSNRACLAAAFTTALFFFSGCSGEQIATVSGKATFKGGQPLAGTTVVFSNAEKQISASGGCGADGTYKLTYKSMNDGAPPGQYVATFYPPSSADPDGLLPPPPCPFHEKYKNSGTSDKNVEVKAGKNEIHFELEAAQ